MKKHKINRWKRTGSYTFQKQLLIRDNRNIYDPMIGDAFFDNPLSLSEWVSQSSKIRVPSLKRSNAVWKRFYELFPYYREHYNELTKKGIKLKKIW